MFCDIILCLNVLSLCINFIFITAYIPGMDVPSSSTSNSSSVVDSKSTSATSVEEQGFAAATLGKLLEFQ